MSFMLHSVVAPLHNKILNELNEKLYNFMQ